MNNIVFSDIAASLSTVLVALIGAISMADFKRHRKHEEIAIAHAKLRAEENQLSMKMLSASVALSIATAIAVEEGKLNGEMKEAKQKAQQVQEEYDAFIKQIAAQQVTQ